MIELLKLPLQAPSYTQICRRTRNLGKILKKLSHCRPCDIVFDSTGLKVYGEGEWKVRQHGVSKRRTWRKLHIAMDPSSGEIILAELTSNGEWSGDGEVARELMKKSPKSVKRVFGDGAYDGIEFRDEVEKTGAEAIVPPPRDGVVHENAKGPLLNVMKQSKKAGLGGDDEPRKIWKILKDYHQRSLVETSMYRIKQITGDTLRSRERENQCTEAHVKCLVINKMTRLGMPVGKWV